MIRRPPRSTSTSPLFPYTTLFLPTLVDQIARLITAGGQIVIDRHAAVPGLAFLRIVIGDQRHAPELPAGIVVIGHQRQPAVRSEEHTSELQSLMRISSAVFCLKKKKILIHYKKRNKKNTKNN